MKKAFYLLLLTVSLSFSMPAANAVTNAAAPAPPSLAARMEHRRLVRRRRRLRRRLRVRIRRLQVRLRRLRVRVRRVAAPKPMRGKKP